MRQCGWIPWFGRVQGHWSLLRKGIRQWVVGAFNTFMWGPPQNQIRVLVVEPRWEAQVQKVNNEEYMYIHVYVCMYPMDTHKYICIHTRIYTPTPHTHSLRTGCWQSYPYCSPPLLTQCLALSQRSNLDCYWVTFETKGLLFWCPFTILSSPLSLALSMNYLQIHFAVVQINNLSCIERCVLVQCPIHRPYSYVDCLFKCIALE